MTTNTTTMTTKTTKSLNERLLQSAKDYAECCWENTQDPPATPEECYEAVKDWLESCSSDDDECEEERLRMLGVMSWGCKNPYVDWEVVMEYVEELFEANKEEDEEDEARECEACYEDFTPSTDHKYDSVCDECVSEKGKIQSLYTPEQYAIAVRN